MAQIPFSCERLFLHSESDIKNDSACKNSTKPWLTINHPINLSDPGYDSTTPGVVLGKETPRIADVSVLAQTPRVGMISFCNHKLWLMQIMVQAT